MPDVITADVYLELNSVPLATPAWRVLDWFPLLNDPPLVGDNRRVSGAAGRRGYPKSRDELRVSLPMAIFGNRDREGATIANPRQGLLDNRAVLRSGLGIASSVDDGTVTGVWHHYDGGTETADVHVLGLFRFQRVSPEAATALLDLIIPAGVFT